MHLASPSLTILADKLDLESFAARAELLAKQSAKIMEAALAQNPLDISNRARLVAFYYQREEADAGGDGKHLQPYFSGEQIGDGLTCCDLRTRHIIWFIDNVPDCVFAGDIYFAIDKNKHQQNYDRVASAWQKAIARSPQNIQIMVNAAFFFCQQDLKECVDLLQAILRLDPDNAWVLAIATTFDCDEILSALASRWYQNIKIELVDDALSKKYSNVCDDAYLDEASYNGDRLSLLTVDTLRKVLSSSPDDVSARVNIWAYYKSRLMANNLLGYNPQAEREMVEQAVWFVNHAVQSKSARQLTDMWLSAPVQSALVRAIQRQADLLSDKSKSKKALEQILKKSFALIDHYHLSITAVGRKKHKNAQKLMEGLALEPPSIAVEKAPFAPVYGLTECADNSSMTSGQLAGSYGWMAPGHLQNLDSEIDDQSIDFYSRALITGAFNFKKASDQWQNNRPPGHVFVKHMTWLIRHVPASKFLTNFYWLGTSDSEWFGAVSKVWREVTAGARQSGVFINAALAHAEADPELALSWLGQAIELEPHNTIVPIITDRLQAMQKLGSKSDPLGFEQALTKEYLEGRKLSYLDEVERLLREHEFVSGNNSEVIARAANRVEIDPPVFACDGPARSLWTIERVLTLNPNDIGLRLEILAPFVSCEFCPFIAQAHPDDLSRNLASVLWFIANVPEFKFPMLFSDAHKDPIGFRTIFEAWKQQHRAYPDSIPAVINLSRCACGLDYTLQEGVDIVAAMLARFPGNSKLESRLLHLRSMLEIR